MHSILIVRTSKKDMNETKKHDRITIPHRLGLMVSTSRQRWGRIWRALEIETVGAPSHKLTILFSYWCRSSLGGSRLVKGTTSRRNILIYMVFHNVPIYALYNHLFHGVNHYLPQSNQQRWCFMFKTPTKCGKVLKCVRPLTSLVLKKGLSFPVTP